MTKKSPVTQRERIGVTDAAALLSVSVSDLKDAVRHERPVHGHALPKAILIGKHYQFWLDEILPLYEKINSRPAGCR